jgi:DNA polymerase III epsilon subunit family exonuclease
MRIELDKDQKKAVEYDRGNLLVIAGPGAGKTRVIIGRMQHLIDNGVQPERILAVTFTNKAAEEITDRIRLVLPPNQAEPTVSTFHAFALKILRDFHETVGLKKFFTIIDDSAQDEILRASLKSHKIAPSVTVLRRLRSHMDSEKAKISFPLYHPNIVGDLSDDIRDVFREYQKFLAENDAVDFNDLLLLALMIIQSDDQARAKYQHRYDHVLLDEFQDINLVQYELTRQIVRDDTQVLGVADADQMIYRWRGSDAKLLNAFLRDFKAEKMELATNYRSSDEIITATKALISHNRQPSERKIKIPDNLEPRVAVLEIVDDSHEAISVVRIIQSNLAKGYKPGDCAVIYRMHGFGDDIEQELSAQDIPLARVRPNDEMIRESMDQMISYLKLSQNMFDWDVKSAWDFPRRILNPLEGYRVTEQARKLGISLFKLIVNREYPVNVSPLALWRLRRFSKLVEELTVLSSELSPSAYFQRLRQKLNTFFSPFTQSEEERLVNELSWLGTGYEPLLKKLFDPDEKPYVLILHPGGTMLQLTALMIARTLRDNLGIASQIAVSGNISESTWQSLSSRVSQDNPLVIVHLGSTEKTEMFLSEFWNRGFAFEMFEISAPLKGEEFTISLTAYRFLIDLITRMPSVPDERLVVYDLETTGIDTRRCDVIELSALSTTLYADEFQTYNQLVKPHSPPPPFITELTGITSEMLKDALEPSRVINEFDAFSRNAVLVGHNIIDFDNRILERLFPAHLGRDFLPDCVDTVLWARELFPGRNNSLAALGERFGLKTEGLHRATEDVRLNREVFYNLMKIDGLQRGLDFSSAAVIFMALIALERETPEKGVGGDFLTGAKRILARKNLNLASLEKDLKRAFSDKASENLMEKISILSKETYSEDPQKEKWEQVADHLANLIIHFEEKSLSEGVTGFLNHFTLLSEIDLLGDNNAVKMMSIHAAKGLEFPIVIIVGMEQGSIPHYLALENLERIEEERRLLYVAMTRAREKIYLVYSPKRDGRYRPPSMFLQEIPEKLVKKYRIQ